MIKIEIKNRWTGSVIFEYCKENNTVADTIKEFIRQSLSNGKTGANLADANLTRANLTGANLADANLTRANLTGADLADADLTRANLTGADLAFADLADADLTGANILTIKNDFWAKLIKLKNEIPAFKEKIKEGKINGSSYEGECCCFVGTFANIKKINYKKLEGVYPDLNSPTEKWFLGIRQGHTPENSTQVKLTLEWIEEFEMYLSAKPLT